MAISNELSSEIASALIETKERSAEELNDLKNILLEVHSTLQSLTESAQRERAKARLMKRAASTVSKQHSFALAGAAGNPIVIGSR